MRWVLHQGRRLPAASIEQAFSIRRLRVSGCLAESIQLIKSRRAIGVRSLHWAFAFGAAAKALPRAVGGLGSDSSPSTLGFIRLSGTSLGGTGRNTHSIATLSGL